MPGRNFPGLFWYLECNFIAEFSSIKRHNQTLIWHSPPSLPMQRCALISQGLAENLWSFNTWIGLDWWIETMAVKTRADSSFFPGSWESRIISNIWSSWMTSAFCPFLWFVFVWGQCVSLPFLFPLKKTQTKSNRNLRQTPWPMHHFSLEFTHSQLFLRSFKNICYQCLLLLRFL